ncbi:MAG: hypothetical protein PUP92_27490 [Rhizonema sp. PD38]|nr:hypothetical protein [Rhizonema sp. PD38]
MSARQSRLSGRLPNRLPGRLPSRLSGRLPSRLPSGLLALSSRLSGNTVQLSSKG